MPTIDTTVQSKAITHPTDSKLLHPGIEILARLARRHGIRLQQSYLRVARRARRKAAKLIHSGQPRHAERQLRTYLGRLLRDWPGVGGLEAWISGRRWKTAPGGWVVIGALEGWHFNIEVITGGLRIAAGVPGTEKPVVWTITG